jgi:DNA replication protein DnaC
MGEVETVGQGLPDWRSRIEEARAKLGDRPEPEPSTELSPAEQEAHERRWATRIPVRYRHARLDQLEGDTAHAAEWDGRSNVLLLGNVGAGKTHAAVALARLVHDDGREVLFRPSVRLLDDLRPDGPHDAYQRACNVDLLVLDDLGAERRTDWTADRISAVLVSRYDDCLPTVVTSNLAPETLEQTVGARIWSRLWDGALRLKISGSDRRKVVA